MGPEISNQNLVIAGMATDIQKLGKNRYEKVQDGCKANPNGDNCDEISKKIIDQNLNKFNKDIFTVGKACLDGKDKANGCDLDKLTNAGFNFYDALGFSGDAFAQDLDSLN